MKERFFSNWRIIKFMGKIDLAVVLFIILYALLINVMTVLVDHENMKHELPEPFPCIIAITIIVISVIVFRYYLGEATNRVRMWICLTWFVIFPTLTNFILINSDQLQDYLYDYTGVFLGGLGQFLYRFMALILCGITTVVFVIVRLIIRKRRIRGKTMTPEKVRCLKEHLHFGILVALAACFLIIVGAEIFNYVDYKTGGERVLNDALFKNEMLEKANHRDLHIEDEVVNTTSILVSVARGDETGIKGRQDLEISHFDMDLIEKKAREYENYLGQIRSENCHPTVLSSAFYDGELRKVFVDLVLVSSEAKTDGDVFVTLIYDDTWGLSDIMCSNSYEEVKKIHRFVR
ncbi:MAG: hypothetical protein K6G63_05905 [Eubacterium sp.]|nr:hypothetical protein [Eubacterium sp.]